MDVWSRMIVGWRVSRSLRRDRALDALERARHALGNMNGLIQHSDRGVQYQSILYTDRIVVAGNASPLGSVGDSYDNATAESVNGLYNAEVI